jgi:hypothetical protein
MLNAEEDTIFRRKGYSETDYLILDSSGAYEGLSRSHFGTILFDSGSWKQNRYGEITLTSNEMFRSIRSPVITVPVYGKEEMALIRNTLPGKIHSFLENNSSAIIEIESFFDFQESIDFDLNVAYTRKRYLLRRDLLHLLAEIERYFENGKENSNLLALTLKCDNVNFFSGSTRHYQTHTPLRINASE